MKIVEFVPPVPHPLWKLCLQMGIPDVIVKVNPSLTGRADPWRFETLRAIVGRLADAGLRVVGLEGDPFDMAPIKQFGEQGGTDAELFARDAALAHYRELLASMGALGIPLLCYNFMVGTGWARSGLRTVRGGARATYFSRAEYARAFGPETPLKLEAEQVRSNYATFLRAVMPSAEAAGVRMGLHPDDPCLPSLGGYARIFGSLEAYDWAWALHPSRANAVTFCQANFTLMGCDLAAAARHFADRIAFVHVRDVAGDRDDFTELFHDQGDVDQFALMRVYRELGLDVPCRCDHVPAMEGELEAKDYIPGYSTLGRLFANGYLKALVSSP